MNSKAKRLLSWLCVLALCMSLLPMTALAAPGSGSSLEPADKYYALNGEEASSDADITLSKTAVDNRDGTYTVTLSATADRVVTAKPTEVVFVIDGSGSMNWCEDKPNEGDTGYIGQGTEHYHGNDNKYNHPYCTLVEKHQKESRWDIALDAIETMMENLGNEGISYKFVVYKGAQSHDGWYTYAQSYNNFEDVQNISPLGGTPLVKGFNEAVKQFGDSSNSNQVMIIVADGASDDNRYPNYEASQFKDKGGEIYTVGFTFSSDDFNALSNGDGYHFTADNADQLKLSMEQISENIKGLISDPLGDKVELVGGVEDIQVSYQGGNSTGNLWVTGDTINWTHNKGLNGTVTLTYTVKLKDSEKKAGEYSVALNDQATLNYRYRYNSWDDNYYSNSVDFPEPVATVKAATLDIQVKDGSSTSAIGAQQWLNLDSNNAFKLNNIPAVGESYGDGKWVESVTVTAKDSDGSDVSGEFTLDSLKTPAPYAYTVTITLTDEEPGPVLDPQATPIKVRVMVDGEEMSAGANVGTYVTVSPDQASKPASWDEESQGSWDPGTFHEENDTVTYDVTYYDCKDISFKATDGYVIEAVEANLVYGQSGCQGITNNNGIVTADNVQGGSTVTVYVRTLYSVEYYLDGEKQTEAPYNDTTKYVTGTTVLEGDIPSVPTLSDGRDAEGYYPVDCNCKEEGKECDHTGYTDVNGAQTPSAARLVIQQDNTITLPALPEKADHTVDGWWLNSEGTGTKYTARTDYAVNADEAENNIIKFYAKSTANTADYTVEYVFLDKNGDPINDTDGWTSDVNTFPQGGTATIGDTVDLEKTNPALPKTVTRDDGNNYVLVEGNYSCEITDEGPNNITVTYALDNWNDKNDTETGGDNTPDYQQALIKYVVADGQDGYGAVSPVTQVETFAETDGAYAGEVTASSTATASDDYAFDYWTKDSDDSWKDWDTELSDTFTAEGGKTYTYTANFDTDSNDDNIPDKYQVFVKFESANTEQGTVSDRANAQENTGINQVYTFEGHATSGNVTPSLDGVEVTAKEGFFFEDFWTKDNGEDNVTPTDLLNDVQGGTTITFYAHFTGNNPNLTVEKSVKVNGEAYDGSVVPAGTELTYTIIVTNTGNTTFDGVTVEDSMWGEKVKTVQVTVKGQEYNLNVETGSWPAVQAEDHVGSKQALVPDDSWTCTYTYTVTKDDVEKGSITNVATATGGENTTGEDEQIVWTNGVVVTPADITIYTGGKGYSGIVGNADTGEIVEDHESTGLPEPGYYIQLPKALNEALLKELGENDDTILDLSQYVTFTYNDGKNERTWNLALYDKDGTSQAYGKNVYRLLPTAEGQDPVRLQITGETVEEGKVLTNDQFTIDLGSDLYRKYDMAIYSGDLDLGYVKLTFKDDGKLGELANKSYTVNTASGELTIRGVTGQEETAVVGQKTDSGFSASVPEGTTYTINDSEIGVNDPSNIQLLVDDIVTEGDSSDAVTNALENKTTEALQEESITLENPTYDKKYMDLVDGNNGNVYVTPSNEVTITWPVPDDAAEDTDFYVVHFDGLDREFSGEDAVTEINKVTPEVLDVTKADDGSITFTTDSFSPFVLVYEQAPAAAPSLTVDKELTAVNGQNPGSSVSVGDKLTYTITVTNGEVALSGVTITDTFNGKGTLNFTTPEGITVSEKQNGTYTITLGDLDANETVTITATYKVQKSDANSDLSNTVTVSAPNPGGGDDPITDEETTPETPVDPYYPPAPPVDPPELNTEDHYAYIVGYEDGTVRPENNITRAEVATIFFRLLTDESRDEFWSQTNPYSDVSADDWYNNAVSTLTNAGILDGYEDGTFRPNGNITRAEFATITSRFFEATYDGEDLFPDIDGHWAKDYINESANAGIVNGYEDGTFRPQKLITRAEAMTMVNRTIDRHPDAEHLLDDMIVWPDNLETAWYYEQVQEATNSHTYTMHTDAEKNPYEIWSELLPVRDWAQLEKEWSDAHSGQTGGEVV